MTTTLAIATSIAALVYVYRRGCDRAWNRGYDKGWSNAKHWMRRGQTRGPVPLDRLMADVLADAGELDARNFDMTHCNETVPNPEQAARWAERREM